MERTVNRRRTALVGAVLLTLLACSILCGCGNSESEPEQVYVYTIEQSAEDASESVGTAETSADESVGTAETSADESVGTAETSADETVAGESESQQGPSAAGRQTSGETRQSLDGPESAEQLTADDVAFETEDVRITMPAEYADRCSWSQPTDESVSLNAADGEAICSITWGETANHGNEAKGESHVIGEVSHGSIGLTAIFFTPGLDDAGKAIYGGSDDQPSSMATEYHLGISPETVISWIELASADGWKKAQIEDGGETASQNADSSEAESAEPPFWGIWIGASKDEAEAWAIAGSASESLSDVDVVLTTDWANLNPEPWYVVTVGRHDTEEQANALLGTVQSAGWPDAYVKYSGERV